MTLSSLDTFIQAFNRSVTTCSCEDVMALNARDDITGWSLEPDDNFMSVGRLESVASEKMRNIANIQIVAERDKWFFGDEQIACLTYLTDKTIVYRDGRESSFNNIRVTWYLENQVDSWQIRHGHWSVAWDPAVIKPYKPIPVRSEMINKASCRAEGQQLEPFQAWLQQCTDAVRNKEIEKLVSELWVQDDNLLCWPIVDCSAMCSRQQIVDFGQERLRDVRIDMHFQNPVVFLGGDYACLSTDILLEKEYASTGERFSVAPVRGTYILEYQGGSWRARHGHLSLPCF
ncbi:nuclear transport factor 2 family protein [Kistimonas asteriae]|uniref:nuclear transport factor 2 family protein n=1 Tax=Kistimonas asteriae TaxID=517724 RepID=UPI001BAB72D3|nr:nuclear transport factor 2 family protein [Kistimonas asteriae]